MSSKMFHFHLTSLLGLALLAAGCGDAPLERGSAVRGLGACTAVSLSASPASPQTVGASVGLTASATCPVGTTPEFHFRTQTPSGTWQTLRIWDTSNTATWDTTGAEPGSYTVYVLAREQGAATWEAYDTISYSLNTGGGPCTGATLSANPASTQTVGGTVTLTASSTCPAGSTPEYHFRALTPAGTWQTLRIWGTSNTATWDTTGASPGIYTIYVLVLNAGATAWEAYDTLTYSLNTGAGPCTATTLSASPASTQTIGNTVTLTASSTCPAGVTPEYHFRVKTPSGTWQTLQVWGTSNTATWDTTGGAVGVHTLYLLTRAQGATTWEAYDTLTYSLNSGNAGPCTAVTLSASPASTATVGNTVTLTANATCPVGSTPEYNFRALTPAGTWQTLRVWGTSNTATWNTTGAATGAYTVYVLALAQGATTWEAYDTVSYTLTNTPSWLDDTSQSCPSLISQVGLFPDPTNRSVTDSRLHSFTPRYPLWTDGAGKGRWLFLPAGTTINNSTRAWTYPDGAALFKHFEYPGQPVETRVMVKQQGTFLYCTYQWNSGGTDASLLAGNKAVPVTITSQPSLAYNIPSERQCKDCHEDNVQRVSGSNVKVPIIGFDELRLNHTLSGQTTTQYAALAQQGLFSAALPSTLDAVSGTAAAIAAKGWLHGNCAHCHNSGFKFEANHALLESTTVNVPANTPYIAPGDAANSVLYQSAVVWGVQGVPDMPRIGVVAPDPSAQNILSTWINSLP